MRNKQTRIEWCKMSSRLCSAEFTPIGQKKFHMFQQMQKIGGGDLTWKIKMFCFGPDNPPNSRQQKQSLLSHLSIFQVENLSPKFSSLLRGFEEYFYSICAEEKVFDIHAVKKQIVTGFQVIGTEDASLLLKPSSVSHSISSQDSITEE